MFESYLLCLIVCIAIAPLTIYHYGMFATMALPLGPPLTLLTSIALFAGFVVLLLGSWFPPGAWLAAKVVWASIAGSMVGKKKVAPGPGTFPTTGALFVGLLVGVILIVVVMLIMRLRVRVVVPMRVILAAKAPGALIQQHTPDPDDRQPRDRPQHRVYFLRKNVSGEKQSR